MSFQEVLSTIKTWSTDEQYRLFDELQTILPPEMDEELLAEVERRSALFDQGNLKAIPWTEARSQARREAGLE